MIKEADSLFEKKDNPQSLIKARNIYLSIVKESENNFEAAWKLARVSAFIGEFYPESSFKGMYEKALEVLQTTLKSETITAEGYLWYGISLGRDGQEKGIMQSLKNLKLMKDLLLKSIEIDPLLESGLAYRALGRLYYTLPKIVGGNLDKSTSYLEQSLEIAENPVSYYYLAETLKAKGELKKVEVYLNLLNKLPDQGKWPVETAVYKAKSLIMINELTPA